MRRDFSQFVTQVWDQLGISPKQLADSAKTPAEKERIAAARVDAYLERMVNGQAQPVQIPPVVQSVLMDKYDAKINQQGVDRAFERAQKVRASADSVRAQQTPQSQVPIPGMPGAQPGAPGAQPQPPAGTPPAATPPGTKRP